MKFELNEHHRNISDEDLISDVQTVSSILNKPSVTMEEYNEHGKYHSGTLTRRFGSWFKVLELAGLKNARSPLNIPDTELFVNLEELWEKIGRQPLYKEMRKPLSKFSAGTYDNRFGSWRKALEAFVNYINADEASDSQEPANQSNGDSATNFSEEIIFRHKTKRDISDRMRFKILSRDNFKCCACGSSPAIIAGTLLHIDHILPWSKGGETALDDLQTLCSKCNLGKGDYISDT